MGPRPADLSPLPARRAGTFRCQQLLMEGAMKLSASNPREREMDDLTGRRSALTRRSALLALSATMVPPDLMAQQTKPVIQTRRLNNVMIAVSNLERSTTFYEKLFGPPVRQGDTLCFASARVRTSLL